MSHLYRLIASVFYIGYIPVAPGSMGSLAALFLYYFLKGDSIVLGIAIIACFLLGLLSAGKSEKLFDKKDSGKIIIDEFTGMLVSLYLLPATMGYIVGAFLLFRFFDIMKPRPVGDLEKLGGSLGVMADDLMAGLYANLILQLIHRLF